MVGILALILTGLLVMDILRERAAAGTAVLLASHHLQEVEQICDRIYLLRAGRIVAGGPTDEVLTYANLTEVFETEVYIDTNDLTGKLLVIPLSGRARRRLDRDGTS